MGMLLLLTFTVLLLSTLAFSLKEEPLAPAPYPLWAHLHWTWLHADQVNQTSATDLVSDYTSRGIPVGATNIDSSWMTAYNNFIVDTKKWSDMKGFIDSMHNDGVRVIFWGTSMINTDNPDYEMVKNNNWCITNNFGVARPLHWWHGDGCLLDYWNPDAKAWWHSQLDNILDLGADGFKCDATDPFMLEYEVSGGAEAYNNQSISYRDYADAYYSDFYDYTNLKRDNQGLIMSRPVDCMIDAVPKVCWPYSPRRVVASGWLGDDDPTFNGIRVCASKVIWSAWLGYPGYGCDIGGYRGEYGNGTPKKHQFIRSTQLNSFLPLMENGGNGEHRPWAIGCSSSDDDNCNNDKETAETLDIYKKFTLEYHRLAPFLLTKGSDAMDTGTSIITPLATNKPEPKELELMKKSDKNHNYPFTVPDSYQFLLGNEILVAPVVHGLSIKDEDHTAKHVDVTFPADAEWISWWHPNTKGIDTTNGKDVTRQVYAPLNSIPVYVKRGSLLPLALTPEKVPAISASMPVIFEWFGPSEGSATSAYAREPTAAGPGVTCNMSIDKKGSLEGDYSPHSGPGGWKIHGISRPLLVKVEGGDCDHSYDIKGTFTVTCKDMSNGATLNAKHVKPQWNEDRDTIRDDIKDKLN